MNHLQQPLSSLARASAIVLSALTSGLNPGCATAPERLPVALFNGRDLSGWRQPTGEWRAARAAALDTADPKRFHIEPGTGVLVNGAQGRTANLLSRFEHSDVQAHIEFCLARNSNSGVYFLGRYEIQIYDSYGVPKDKYPGIECGGIYPRWIQNKEFDGHSPRVNASKPPGAWQTFDVTFRAPRFDAAGTKTENARFVKVAHNGVVIHENVALTGPTRAAVFENDEQPIGPLMLQGDHGPIAYRNLRLKPVALE